MIKLLVVDDSPLMRRLLTDIFTSAGDFLIEAARNGAEALEKIQVFQPDVITLDIQMPGMDGLACLDHIMMLRPCPVVMVSSLTKAGADETLEALALGAVDFIPKPRGAVSLEIDEISEMLVDKVRAAASARISRATRLRERVRARASGALRATPAPRRTARRAVKGTHPVQALPPGAHVVLVGCSTGGPPALDALLGQLPADFPWPIVIAQHMPASFTGALARRLDRLCAIGVCEIDQMMPLSPGTAYIGRGEADLLLSKRSGQLVAMPAPSSSDYFWHPSVNRLVDSAMRHVAPEKLVGVLMTGMGDDGARAMTNLKALGGQTIAEAAETAVVWGMPGALVALGGASHVRALDGIADALLAMAGR